MLFSSNTFIYVFLPVVVLACLVAPMRLRNGVLTAASLVFYAWGEVEWTWVLLVSIAMNWAFGRMIGQASGGVRGRRLLLLFSCVGANLAILAWFKYADFLVAGINHVLGTSLGQPHVHLPLGISFFTFHSISYVVDVHRGDMPAQRSISRLALYICLFPQLIAGPIVRYKEIGSQIDGDRPVRVDEMAEGVARFVRGLAKKVLVANPVGGLADLAFAMPADERTAAVAWAGILAYTIQIYFDFSGYSDMAIGLARIFGFRFPENFDHPYVARSVQDFWRRWHMSLSRWFRDYLYIPLGGNRRGAARTYVNLYVVFLLCGLWHGATLAFVAWGFVHGTFLALERTRLVASVLARAPRPLLHAYTMAVVVAAWVLFRGATLPAAASYYSSLLGRTAGAQAQPLAAIVSPVTLLAFLVGVVLSMPVRSAAMGLLRDRMPSAHAWARATVVPLMLAACMVRLAADSYNPFIYFRF